MNVNLNHGLTFFKRSFLTDRFSSCIGAIMLLSVCGVTALLQWRITKPASAPSSVQAAQNALPYEPVESALREYLLARQQSLQRKNVSPELPMDSESEQNTLLNPPAVFVKGVVLSGTKKFALLAVDGAAQYVIARKGDVIAEALEVAEINSRGVSFCWRGRNFFVPLE